MVAVIEAGERYADEQITASEFERFEYRAPARPWSDGAVTSSWPGGTVADYAVMGMIRALGKGQARVASDLLRDVFGNPFRPLPVVPPTILRWNDGTVARIAQGIYEERAFERLPILHDALLDAGCDNEDLLAHCKSAGPHVRGCWAIDLIRGKE